MAGSRHDRIIALRDLTSYPGGETLDVLVYLPWSRDHSRRVWLMAPHSSPDISFDDTVLHPCCAYAGAPRWVDYGVAQLPIVEDPGWYEGEYHFLSLRGLDTAECAEAFLVVSDKLDLQLEGCTLDAAERKLWGMARADAGTSTLHPARVTAGASCSFVARYTAGEHGLPAGSVVRFTLPRSFSMPQVADPAQPGYIAIGDTALPVIFSGVEVPRESHEQWDVFFRLEAGLPPVAGFSVHYRTAHMHIFPGRFADAERRYWFSHMPLLCAAVALPGGQFTSLLEENAHTFEVTPGPAERLHLFLPGRLIAGDSARLRATYSDHFRNTPPSGPIDADIEIRLAGPGGQIALGSPAGHFVARHRFEMDLPSLLPGVYRALALRPSSGEEIARSNPLEIVEAGVAQDRLYWGEIHGHTEMSDGSGEFGELYRHAREEGCLDFAAACDHAEYISDNQWQWMQDVTNAHNQPGRFATLIGYEWEGVQHDRNVWSARDRLPLCRGKQSAYTTLDAVWSRFHGDEGIVGGVHASLAHNTTREHWRQHDPAVERIVEIYSCWGANDRRDSALVPDWIKRRDAAASGPPAMTANDILRSGAHTGFTGGGDCHEGHCGFSSDDMSGQGRTPHTFAAVLLYRSGMTAATMPALDRPSLLSALRNRRTYATTGARIVLDFSAGALPMGAVGEADSVRCRAAIHAVQPIASVEIIRDGVEVWSAQDCGLDTTIDWTDPEPMAGEHYYYLHVVQSDGEMAWSSPIWVIRHPEGVSS